MAATPNVSFEYDNAGNRTSMTDGLGSVSYNYNRLSQLTSETRTFTGVTGSFTLSYDYNLGGELISVTNPWSAQVGYNYDRVGRPTGVTGSGYSGVSSYVNSFGYRAFGMKQMSYANGKTLSVNYDNRMRMTRWDVAGVLGSDYEYRWEDTFRPTSLLPVRSSIRVENYEIQKNCLCVPSACCHSFLTSEQPISAH